ncbi:MAG: T9SS C-terminal target domain-containing protein [Bacteroidetes bacterium]|nr:MAG: T9SS C-terminal target domain-containing protein [Bacteroidota bacterium]
MKKIFIYSSLLFILCNTAQAQTLFNNGGFETWTNAKGYNEAEHWFSLNVLSTSGGGFEESTTATFDAYAGTQAALLISQENFFQNIPGLLCSGSLINDEGEPDLSNLGIPYTNRPSAFEFYYKYYPAPGDSAIGYVMLTKWNTTTQKRDTIGLGEFSVGDSVKTYTKKQVDLTYISNAQPDSIVVFFSTSYDGFDPKIGSQFFIDEFKMNFPVGLNQNTIILEESLIIYPNPSAGVINIVSNHTTSGMVIYDVTGKCVFSLNNQEVNTQLSTVGWKPGIYIVEASQGEKILRKKIIVQ